MYFLAAKGKEIHVIQLDSNTWSLDLEVIQGLLGADAVYYFQVKKVKTTPMKHEGRLIHTT